MTRNPLLIALLMLAAIIGAIEALRGRDGDLDTGPVDQAPSAMGGSAAGPVEGAPADGEAISDTRALAELSSGD